MASLAAITSVTAGAASAMSSVITTVSSHNATSVSAGGTYTISGDDRLN